MEPVTEVIMTRETVEISNGRKLYNYTFQERVIDQTKPQEGKPEEPEESS